MRSTVHVTRGPRALRRLLREACCDLRSLDLDGFRHWLRRNLARWERDPIFVQRTRIRDLRRAHPALSALEQEHRRAVAADAASPAHARLRRLERDLAGAGHALAGLTAALAHAAPEKRPALQQKLEAFEARQQALRAEQAALAASSPARQALLRLDAERRRLRTATGLDREEAHLKALLKGRGRRTGRAGERFERVALALTRHYFVPDLLRDSPEGAEQRLRVLTGVTLGAARTEFDQLVIRLPHDRNGPVEVLAVVEVKRNLNDLAHGFRQRRENLAWLTGAADGYDAALYRTRHFRSGHFDREAVHRHRDETFVFAPLSFHRFRRTPDAGPVPDGLYFITRAGPLWGVSTAVLARISHRIATDPHWDPDDAAYLRTLLDWCRTLAEEVEAPDVLRMYAAAPGGARRILVVDR